MVKPLLAAVLMTAASFVFAQVEVVDRSPASRTAMPQANSDAAPAPAGNQQAGELFYQLQLLQQEVLELRGIVEQQAYELKRLKQQRLDDYLDLDRRISQLAGSSVAGNPPSAGNTPSAPPTAGTVSPQDELKSYRNAIDLVLKKQDYDTAVVKLKEHLEQYPNGRYAGNSLYWLGEIYLLKGELEDARQWFVQLLSDFPTHAKVPDTQFKLGKVYHLLGNLDESRQLLDKAASGGGNAGKLARDYIKQNFNS